MNQKLNITLLPKQVLRETAKEVPVKEISGSKIRNLINGMKEVLKNSKDGVGLAAPQVGRSLRIFLVSEEVERLGNEENAIIETSEIAEKNGDRLVVSDKIEPDKNKKREWKFYVFINPAVKKISRKKTEYPEGCLSIPGRFGMVSRPEKITVEAYDENGKRFVRGASKFTARVIQHELDHINGILFIDKAHKYLNIGGDIKNK